MQTRSSYEISKFKLNSVKTTLGDNTSEVIMDDFKKEIAVIAEMQGEREAQEDSYLVGLTKSFIKLNEVQRVSALKATIKHLHKKMLMEAKELAIQGTTFSAVIVVCEDDEIKTYTVNIGDSGAFLATKNGKEATVKALTKKWHSPKDAEECKRVEDAGLEVLRNRVSNRLAVSRAFGDKETFSATSTFSNFKRYLFSTENTWEKGYFCEPDVETYSVKRDKLTFGKKMLILNICDGVFENLKKSLPPLLASEDYIREILEQEEGPNINLARAIRNKAYRDGSQDNITVMAAEVETQSTQVATYLVLCDGHNGADLAKFMTKNFPDVFEYEISEQLKIKKDTLSQLGLFSERAFNSTNALELLGTAIADSERMMLHLNQQTETLPVITCNIL